MCGSIAHTYIYGIACMPAEVRMYVYPVGYRVWPAN